MFHSRSHPKTLAPSSARALASSTPLLKKREIEKKIILNSCHVLARGGGDGAGVAVSLDGAHPPVVGEGKANVVPHRVRHKVDCVLFKTWGLVGKLCFFSQTKPASLRVMVAGSILRWPNQVMSESSPT